MNKKVTSFLSVIIILIFIGYIIYDIALSETKVTTETKGNDIRMDQDKWFVSKVFDPGRDSLKAVTISSTGFIYLGGNSWVASYDKDFNLLWNIQTAKPIASLSISGDTIYASTLETILLISSRGESLDEWGPFEDNAIITSVTSSRSLIAFADASNRMVIILTRKGDVKEIIKKTDDPFIIPSPYFDVALDENDRLYTANTGYRRIETRKTDGSLISYFGLPGTAPDAFSGCCNPAHFALIPDGFVTAEKGINQIKIFDQNGKFVEYVSSVNKFAPAIPLDIASYGESTIYAANPADSKLYIFTRK
jgi:hypothetical protein